MIKQIQLVLCSVLLLMGSVVLVKADDALAEGLKWSPDGRWIVVNTSSGLWVFDTQNPDAEPKVYYDSEEVRLTAFNPVSDELAVLITDWNNYTYLHSVLNLETGEYIVEANLMGGGGGDSNPIIPTDPIYDLRYSADGSFLAMTLGNLIYFYDPLSNFNRLLAQYVIFDYYTGGNSVSLAQMGDTSNVLVLSWSSENNLVLLNPADGIVSSYDTDISNLKTVYAVDETHALLLTNDASYVFDTDTSEYALLATAPEGQSFETSAYLAASGTLYVGGYGYWQSIDVATGSVKQTVTVETPVEYTRFVAFDFSPDGSQFVSLQSDGKITIWDSASGESIQELGSFTGGMNIKWG
ncbi:MAG: WD40 repeat domain-containing protein [Anaerolineaceae bacterium]|nr:WD40 repeat domain-containing protein [Anaerolineaceae bacterium]